MLVVFGIVELDAAQVPRVIPADGVAGQGDSLIATQSGGLVHGARVNAAAGQIGFGANDEERLSLMQDRQSREIDEAAIHDVEAARFECRAH